MFVTMQDTALCTPHAIHTGTVLLNAMCSHWQHLPRQHLPAPACNHTSTILCCARQRVLRAAQHQTLKQGTIMPTTERPYSTGTRPWHIGCHQSGCMSVICHLTVREASSKAVEGRGCACAGRQLCLLPCQAKQWLKEIRCSLPGCICVGPKPHHSWCAPSPCMCLLNTASTHAARYSKITRQHRT